jgi:hypothetical protein
VRKDLSISQRAVQGGHALAEFLLHGPKSSWKNGTLVYLGVKNLQQLDRLVYILINENVPFVEFYEPDIDQITAVATDQHVNFFNKLNLL